MLPAIISLFPRSFILIMLLISFGFFLLNERVSFSPVCLQVPPLSFSLAKSLQESGLDKRPSVSFASSS